MSQECGAHVRDAVQDKGKLGAGDDVRKPRLFYAGTLPAFAEKPYPEEDWGKEEHRC